MGDTEYTIVDWLSAGLAVCTIVISFMTYLYFKARLKIKSLKEENDGLKNTIKIREDAFHELTVKNDDLIKDYTKLKEGNTIHEVRVIGAKPIGVSAKFMLPVFDRYSIPEEELMADTKIELAQRLGVYCLQNNYIHFEEYDDPMCMAKRLTAYMSVASNNEEIVKVLKPDPILAIDMNKVRELSAGFNCYKRGE